MTLRICKLRDMPFPQLVLYFTKQKWLFVYTHALFLVNVLMMYVRMHVVRDDFENNSDLSTRKDNPNKIMSTNANILVTAK